MARQVQPAKPLDTWKEIIGDVEDQIPPSDQACEVNSAHFQASEVEADEFESIYLWFLA
jgi:hypothetical protein